MSVLVAEERAYMQAAQTRWDKAVESARSSLTHYDLPARNLAEKLFTSDMGSFRSMFGGREQFGGELRGFDPPCDVCGILEFVPHFIDYHIRDDGEPGIGYHRYNRVSGEYELCRPQQQGAQPYFCCDIDWLRGFDPSAQYVTEARALEVVEWYAADRERMRQYMIEANARYVENGDAPLWDAEEIEDYEETHHQRDMREIVRELRGEDV